MADKVQAAFPLPKSSLHDQNDRFRAQYPLPTFSETV